MSQSPIELDSKSAHSLANPLKVLAIDYPKKGKCYRGEFIEEGHGNFELREAGPRVTYLGREFELKRVHIHEPSEHVVKLENSGHSVPCDYEVHFVHLPVGGELSDPKVVIGVLYREASEKQAPAQVKSFFESLATRRGRSKGKSDAEFGIDPLRFFPVLPNGEADLVNWFHYQGSLTGYPFSEDVSWFVMRDVSLVAPQFSQQLEDHAEHHARELQPLDRRIVLRSF